jgi:hypothetical protein
MKPICVPCARFYRPKRNGVYLCEGMPHGPEWDGQIGRDSPGWLPYKIWLGDLWECPNCHSQIISGVGAQPLDEHYTATFKQNLARTNALSYFIKDC